LTRYLAVNLAKYNIRVNALSPAGVFNNQPQEFLKNYVPKCPMGRMLNREELVGPLLFLLSSASSYVTGHNLLVDGGFTVL
jgi:NAD(P)-dependent dehydrogenase (short-subunit alcohol dehydrogenase family)